jgi:tRNA (mo5U34)-methyltransferase
MTTLDLQSAVQAFPFWYHKIELPNGIVTPGWAPLSVEAYKIPEDLTGMRVLDVGAWDGFWSFEALKRGASEVVAIDDFSDYLGALENKDRKAWETFDLCRDALGYSEKVCQRYEMSVYEATADKLGEFDVVFFFGTLYHLRYPLLALDLLSAMCKKHLYVETAILDDFSPYQGGLGNGYDGAQPVMEFYPNNEYGGNDTNWWAPSLSCLGLMTMAAGFHDVEVWKLTTTPQHVSQCRGFAHGVKL